MTRRLRRRPRRRRPAGRAWSRGCRRASPSIVAERGDDERGRHRHQPPGPGTRVLRRAAAARTPARPSRSGWPRRRPRTAASRRRRSRGSTSTLPACATTWPIRPGPRRADAVELEVDGETVPFVVRTERGVINRSVYRSSLLDPAPPAARRAGDLDATAAPGTSASSTASAAAAAPRSPRASCGTGAPSLDLLRRGYATATATFNTFQVHVQRRDLGRDDVDGQGALRRDATASPVHTIGEGGSGGAIQQLLIAQNYPGLLDAIAPPLPFPDALSISRRRVRLRPARPTTTARPTAPRLTPEQRAAINGHAVADTCDLWNASFAVRHRPVAGCPFDVAAVFGAGSTMTFADHPARRDLRRRVQPRRLALHRLGDATWRITGRDPDTGFASSGYDNEGIQYGLDALNAGTDHARPVRRPQRRASAASTRRPAPARAVGGRPPSWPAGPTPPAGCPARTAGCPTRR